MAERDPISEQQPRDVFIDCINNRINTIESRINFFEENIPTLGRWQFLKRRSFKKMLEEDKQRLHQDALSLASHQIEKVADRLSSTF